MWPQIKLVVIFDCQKTKDMGIFQNDLMWLIMIAHMKTQLQAQTHGYKIKFHVVSNA